MRQEDENEIGKPGVTAGQSEDRAVDSTGGQIWSQADLTELTELQDSFEGTDMPDGSSPDTDADWLREDPLLDMVGAQASQGQSIARGGLVQRALAKLRIKPKTRPGPADTSSTGGVSLGKDGMEAEVAVKSGSRFSRRAGRKEKVDVASGNPPITVVLGYIPESSRKDAIQHAKGYAEDHLDAVENAWIALTGFRGGFIFELHEGGDGKAYLPEIVEALTTDPDMIVWLPSGTKLNRVLTVEMVNGFPYPTILTEEESAAVRASGQVALRRRGKMERLIKKGERMLIAGVALAATSSIALIGSVWYGIGVNQQPVPFRTYNAEILPHGQIISLSDALRNDRWVSSIKFEDGQWRAEFEEVASITLPDDTAAAQQMSDELMSIEAGVRDRLSGNSEAEIPTLTPLEEPLSPDVEDGGAAAASPSVVALSAQDIDMYIVEIENTPDAFIARLDDPDFRTAVIETPRLRLAGFRNESVRAALLEDQTPSQEED